MIGEVLGGKTDFIHTALSRGLDPNDTDKLGRSLLHFAVDYPEIIKVLLNAGANANIPDREGKTPLHFAAERRRIDSAQLLLDAGANVDAQDVHGNGPLFVATFNCRSDGGMMIRLLLNNGANPNIPNARGVTPIQLAKRISNYNVAQWFSISR